ncbi:MAG: hypothetical protein NVSMB44_10620 [Ktedonobacteraceae bacterium]
MSIRSGRGESVPLAWSQIEDDTRDEGTIVQSIPADEQLALLTPPEERRLVTIMFADITGSTPLADRLDPEDMRAILTGYFNLMTEQIRKHDGTVEKYIGDAVMAVFGTPIAHEDDPDRAIRAALDMQSALTRFNAERLARDPTATRLQMRIGINTGEVAAQSNTAPQHQDFLITGDAVNIAARLQQIATPDTILVGERTYRSTRELFEYKVIAPLSIKGKTDPVTAYMVQRHRQSSTAVIRHPRGLSGQRVPLVGRTLELTLLHANYARVRAERRPHLITILGVPGVGKTRLARDFIAREEERAKSTAGDDVYAPRVLKGRCPPYGEGMTYWPLIEILRSLLNIEDSENNEILQERFVHFLRDIFVRARRTEAPEEIAETLLRRIGGGLSATEARAEAPIHRERPKPELRSTSQSANLKQSATQGALLRAWRILFEALGELQPLIIVVDDLQWADEALLDLLEYLTDRITTVPILFLCPARPDFLEHRRNWGGGQRNFTAIELESLSWEESSSLIDALLDSNDMPDALRHTILARAEGNPFFVEEIIRMLIDQGILVREEGQQEGAGHRWHMKDSVYTLPDTIGQVGEQREEDLLNNRYPLALPQLPHVPDTVQGVLAARVDLLAPAEKLILQHAAIVGRSFWLSSLLELAVGLDIETVLASLTALIRRDFVVEIEKATITNPVEPDRAFSFKHILIRDVVYNNIPRMRRSLEHARIALWLDEQTVERRETFIEQLAYHYQQALANWSTGSAVDSIEIERFHKRRYGRSILLTRTDLRAKAIEFLTLTGDQALHGYFGLRALRAYSDAFDLLVDGQADALKRSKMLEKIGDAYAQRGNLDEAWQYYRRALRLTTEEGTHVSNDYLLDLYEQLSLLASRWLARFHTPPDLQELRGYIDAGLQLLEGKQLSREHIAFLTYQAFWYIRQLENAPREQKPGLVEQALSSGHEALAMAEELNSPRTLSLTLDAVGFIYFKYHKYDKALEIQTRRRLLEDLLDDREEIYDLYLSLGGAHEDVADYANALTFYGRAWRDALTMESPTMVLSSMVGRMRTWRQWNRWDDAQQVAQEILQFIERYQPEEKSQLWALETLAAIEYHRGKQETGDQYARQYKRLLDSQIARSKGDEKARIETRMHAIHYAQGDWQRAASDYKEKLAQSEPFPTPTILSTLAEILLLTGEAEQHASIYERAVDLARQSGARKGLIIALRSRGRFYTEQQQWGLAETDLLQALRDCETLDLPWEHAHTLYYLAMFYKQRANAVLAPDRHTSDIDRAHYHFEQALGFYESLDARPSIERVRSSLSQDRIATTS